MRERLHRLLYERPLVVMAGLVILHLVVTGLAFDPSPHGGGDNTAYLALARSLLDHGRYVELWDPARPPHTQYPPGFPAILAVAWALGLRSWFALKLLILGFSAGAVGLSYLWMRHRVRPGIALGLGVLLAVAPGLAAESPWVLSDLPFWAVTMAALLALERKRTGWGIALAFAALAIRTAGLPLLVALILWLAVRRRWKVAAGAALGLVVIGVLWSLRGAGSPYVSQFWLVNPYVPEAGRVGVMGLLDRVVGNLDRYGLTNLPRTLTGTGGLLGAVVGPTVAAVATLGFGRRVFRMARSARSAASAPGARWLVELFTVLYAGMLLLWPEPWASDRFLIPLLPILLVYLAEGVELVPRPRARRAVRWVGGAILLGIGVPSTVMLWQDASLCRAEVRVVGVAGCRPPAHQAFLELAEWSRGRLPEDAVVISRKPRQWYWFSGYPGRVYPFSLEPDRLLEAAREADARYLVLDELGGTSEVYLLPAVVANRRWFCLIQRIPQGEAAGALLGVLPAPWDPAEFGVGDPLGGPGLDLHLPFCPPSFTRER